MDGAVTDMERAGSASAVPSSGRRVSLPVFRSRALATLTSRREGAAAVEFALVAPLFIMLLLTTFAYGIYLSAAHSIQQITAEAARAAVAGITNEEREEIATEFVNKATIDSSLISRANLAVEVKQDAADPTRFSVILSYSATNLPIWQLYAFALPDTVIRRQTTIRIGGK